MKNLSAEFCEEYLKTFQVRLVDNPELRRQSQRLRYQVYCVEHPFEPRNGEELERDRFDERAAHALLYHRRSAEPVGTVRVVFPDTFQAAGSLPIHDVCPAGILADANLPKDRTAEISRFAISKFRLHRVLTQFGGLQHGYEDSRRVVAFACVGLIAAVRQISVAHGITHLAAIMRPALLRRMRGLGVTFDHLDKPVEHHGLRIPCYTRIDAIEASLRRHRPDLWAVLAHA